MTRALSCPISTLRPMTLFTATACEGILRNSPLFYRSCFRQVGDFFFVVTVSVRRPLDPDRGHQRGHSRRTYFGNKAVFAYVNAVGRALSWRAVC
jgi:hypothetical protein